MFVFRVCARARGMENQRMIIDMKSNNEKPATLDLVLKVCWYEMIESGEKREEYRKIGAYWSKRLLVSPITTKCDSGVPTQEYGDISIVPGAAFRKFAFVRFHRAYTSTTMTFAVDGIDIAEGNPEWGAIPGVKYFVIKLGNRIK